MNRDRTSLEHMLSHAIEAVQFTACRQRSDLDNDRLLELGLIRLIEIIGEAANRVSSESRSAIDAIPWPQVVAMRNRLVHGYDSVDRDMLWTTIVDDLPHLIATLQAYLNPPAT